jgi:outer membrane protein assembly factor BamB
LIAGLDRRDGRELWRRTDIGSHEMYPNYGDGLVVDQQVILGMPSIEPSIHALDAATGETVWSLTATTGGGSPAGSLTFGPGRSAYGLSHRPELFCIDTSTGEERFRVAVEGRYTWAAPLVSDGTVVVMSADALLFGFDADDGSELWRVEVPAAAAPGFAPYRGRGPSSITSPVQACEGGEIRCFAASTDGSVWSISPGTGAVDRLVQLPAAVTAAIAASGGVLIVPTADGSLWCVDTMSR